MADAVDARVNKAAPEPPFDGGCACGAVRYRMHARPMYVHCCHCTRCQRETGSPFAHQAMIEFTAFSLLCGEPEYVPVPTDSGNKHWVARCPDCKTAMWNEHGTRKAITRYVRVGTLDAPEACPPLAHIFTRSKQPWLALPEGSKQYPAYYDASKAWPKASLERYAAAKAARAQERVNERTQRASRKSRQSSKAE
nr:GFA family protein [Casimicrobium huifangae]